MRKAIRHQIIEEDMQRIVSAGLPWAQLAGKTVLVTGANGFLPAYMVETLLYLNEHHLEVPCRIICLVRNLARGEARFAAYRGRSDLKWLEQDVCDPLRVDEPVHFVVHAASQASPKYYGSDPVGTLSANVLGTHHLLKMAATQPVEAFLYFSSGEVYGQVDPEKIPIAESSYGYLDPMEVRSCYSESKRMGETMCVSWAHQHGVPAKIVRPFHTYGPGMRLDDGRVFTDFVANVVRQQDIVLKSDGRAIRPFCYLADATVGFFTILLRGVTGQAYNIGNPNTEISIRELAQTLVGLFPERGLQVVFAQPALAEGYLPSPIQRNSPDISKANRLGWYPETAVATGFTRTIRSFE